MSLKLSHMQMLMMFGFYHHFRKTFTDIRKLLLRMRTEFAIRKYNSPFGRFFKIYNFYDSKVFFFCNNIFGAKHNKPNCLKSLWAILGYPYYIYVSEIPLFQYESDLRTNEHHLSNRENKASKTCRTIRELNPWPLRYWYIPLPTVLRSKPGNWSFCWFEHVINPLNNLQSFIYHINSQLQTGFRWECITLVDNVNLDLFYHLSDHSAIRIAHV